MNLDTNADIKNPLSNVFEKTTSSYKFLFFKTLLDIQGLTGVIEHKHTEISLEKLYYLFLVNSWYPISMFKLSFGKQDKIGNLIQNLKSKVDNRVLNSLDIKFPELQNVLIHASDDYFKEAFKHLDKYVKYRFLTSWMREELRGIPDQDKNAKIRKLLEEDYISEKKYPYHFITVNNKEYLVINPTFAEYLRENFLILYDWWRWNFAKYLSEKNPMTPAILNKMESPQKRNLILARKYWTEIISLNNGNIRCIYSGDTIIRVESLDHFLPWSFLPYDRIWNIIPTSIVINREKSNTLPNLEKYLNPFVDFQISSLKKYIYSQEKKSINNSVLDEEFNISDSFSIFRQINSKDVHTKYINTIKKYYEIALTQGFSKGWEINL